MRSVAVIRADGFRDETRGDDWALIKLDRALDLPVLALGQGGADEAGPMTILGWGQTSEKSPRQQQRLRYADVSVVDDEQCAKAYRKVGVELVEDEAICAGRAGRRHLPGRLRRPDGPATADDRGCRWASSAGGSAAPAAGYPGVYTQVSAFRADIRAATRKLELSAFDSDALRVGADWRSSATIGG